jgi:hypothetical protein
MLLIFQQHPGALFFRIRGWPKCNVAFLSTRRENMPDDPVAGIPESPKDKPQEPDTL